MLMVLSGISGCITSEQTFINPEFEANHLSATIKLSSIAPVFRPALFGYQTYYDTVLGDGSAVRYSGLHLLAPDTDYVITSKAAIFEFGNDSLRCRVHYAAVANRATYTGHGLVLDALSKDKNQQTYNIVTADIRGSISCAGLADSAVFAFRGYKGYLVIDKDSFMVSDQFDHPGIMRTRIGLQVMKGDTVYGVFNTFTGMAPHRAYVYAKASPLQQMLIGAYFAVLAWYVYEW